MYLLIKIRSIKPFNYFYKLEISPINIFHRIINQKQKSKLINTNYINKRFNIIKNLQYVTNKLKYRRQTFFLALSYLDNIYSKASLVHDIKPELVALCCLIIAGIQYLILSKV